MQGTKGCEIIPEIQKDKLEYIIDKGQDKRVESYSGFGPPFRDPKVSMTDLDQLLKGAGITHLFVVGLAYDVCVFHTAIDAVEHGYKTFVIKSAAKAANQTADGLALNVKKLQDGGVSVIDMDSKELEDLKRS